MSQCGAAGMRSAWAEDPPSAIAQRHSGTRRRAMSSLSTGLSAKKSFQERAVLAVDRHPGDDGHPAAASAVVHPLVLGRPGRNRVQEVVLVALPRYPPTFLLANAELADRLHLEPE